MLDPFGRLSCHSVSAQNTSSRRNGRNSDQQLEYVRRRIRAPAAAGNLSKAAKELVSSGLHQTTATVQPKLENLHLQAQLPLCSCGPHLTPPAECEPPQVKFSVLPNCFRPTLTHVIYLERHQLRPAPRWYTIIAIVDGTCFPRNTCDTHDPRHSFKVARSPNNALVNAIAIATGTISRPVTRRHGRRRTRPSPPSTIFALRRPTHNWPRSTSSLPGRIR